MKFKLKEIILNITKRCPYTCSFCLLNAKNSARDIIRAPRDELQKEKWVYTIDWIIKNNPIEDMDISGGDSINYNGKIELTIDFPPSKEDIYRGTYNKENYLFAKTLVESGYDVNITTVIRKDNGRYMNEITETIESIKPHSWTLIPYYNVGRGRYIKLENDVLELRNIYKYLIENSPIDNIKFQHTFFMFIDKDRFQCEIPYQIGILPNGKVVYCPWGLDFYGNPLKWNMIGDSTLNNIEEIISKRERTLELKFKEEGFNFCRTRLGEDYDN